MNNEPETMSGGYSEESGASPVQSTLSKAGEVIQPARDYIQDNPLPGVVGAFLLGAVIGMMISHKDHECKTEEMGKHMKTWWDHASAGVADKFHKAPFMMRKEPTLLEHLADMGRKLSPW